MKTFIAYTLILVGLPILIGQILAKISSLPFSVAIGLTRRGQESPVQIAEAVIEGKKWAIRGPVNVDVRDRIAHICLDMLSGFWAVLGGGFVFHLFALSPGVSVLLIVASWELFFTLSYGQSRRVLFGTLMGMVIGWYPVIRLWSAT